MATRIELRRGTAAQWTSANPVLHTGEAGVETDTHRLKVGDGTTAWADLGYVDQAALAAVTNVIGGAPGALDTLNELAAALADDANFATTVTNALALKASQASLNAEASTRATADTTNLATATGRALAFALVLGG